MPTPVLYRKWRPQTLSQVVGQEHVTRTLLNALIAGRVAHAYLFCGPRGTGKTSTARILAKAVNCLENDGKGEPCGACSVCQAIADGNAMDMIEIDAASNRGIDDIRDLREKVNFAPNQARFKVYIMDEVHMLTDSAFNALLKTLEEPPPFTIFVLATTEVHEVPVTIVSRCQRFDFRRLSASDLTGYLNTICQGEGIQAEEDALAIIARTANGGARDAVNLLEQVEVASEGVVTVDAVEQVLGLVSNPLAIQVARAVVGQALPEGLNGIQAARESGANLAQFGKEVTEHLRGLLLLKAGVPEALSLPAESIKELTGLVQTVSLQQITRAVNAFSQLDFRGVEGSSLPLELALVEALQAPAAPAAAAAPPAQAAPARATAAPATAAPRQPAAAKEAQPVPAVTPASSKPAAEEPPAREPAVAASPVTQPEPAPAPAPVASENPGESELEKMRRLLKEVKVPQMRFIESLFRSGCVIDRIEEQILVLSFRPALASHKERMERPENLRYAEDAIRQLSGTPYRIRCILNDNPTGSQPPNGGAGGHLVQAALNAGARRVNPPSQEA